MSVVAIIAIYAAVISTLALAWQIYTWSKSRADIRITAKINHDDDPDRPPTSRAECICRIVNSGGYPASLIDVWADQVTTVDVLGIVSTRRDVDGVSLPLLLGPGECYVWRFSFPKGYGLRCCAKDALGPVYKCGVSSRETSGWQ